LAGEIKNNQRADWLAVRIPALAGIGVEAGEFIARLAVARKLAFTHFLRICDEIGSSLVVQGHHLKGQS